MLNTDYKTRLGTWAEVGYKNIYVLNVIKKTFVPLVDSETGNIIDHTIYGRCDREYKCGYNKIKTGKDTVLGSYYYKNNNDFTIRTVKDDSRSRKPSYIYNQIKMDSLEKWTINNLALYLWDKTKIHYDDICDAFYKYHIGTSTHSYTKNACIFWLTDTLGNTRSGKIIQYDFETGKRVRTEPAVRWMHTTLKLKNYNLKPCLFGEHLLSMNKSMPVAVVESEKTALIQSLFNKDYIWLSTGGKGNLNDRVKNVLQERDVTVYPDIDAENDWYIKCQDYDFKFRSTRQEMRANGYTWDSDDDIGDMTLWLKRK